MDRRIKHIAEEIRHLEDHIQNGIDVKESEAKIEQIMMGLDTKIMMQLVLYLEEKQYE